MSAVIGGSKTDGIFADEAELILQAIPNGRRVELITGERYYTSAFNDTGEALTLAGGNYANLIESGGGGGGLPINAMLEINSTDDLYIATDSTEWLRTGFIETDAESYPDASISYLVTSITYSGTSFSIGEVLSPRALAWDGLHFWVANVTDRAVHQYTSAGVYTGFNFSVLGEMISPQGICWDGLHFWVLDGDTAKAYQYTSVGVYTGFNFSVFGEESQPKGITWDGGHFWVVGLGSDTAYQYTSAGVYTGVSFSVATQSGGPEDITWDGGYFWVIAATGTTVFRYTSAGDYTGDSFIVSDQDANSYGIASVGSDLWVTGFISKNVYKYDVQGLSHVGVPNRSQGESGLPNFTRIK